MTRGFTDEVIETTIAALLAQGLLSNARFAESFIHSRFQRGQGPQKIRVELRERGIDASLVPQELNTTPQKMLIGKMNFIVSGFMSLILIYLFWFTKI